MATRQVELYYDQNGITVQRATRNDAEHIAYNMRRQDIEEVWASHHFTPYEAVKFSIDKTLMCFSVRIKGEPVLMFGCNGESLIGNSAVVWMLSTENINKIGLRFARHSRHFIEMMLETYPYLYNFVHDGNTVSKAWLRVIGAKMEEPKPFGVSGELFRYFYFKRGS